MFDLTTTNTDVQTMTSREIADLTGKQHDNVRRDILHMASELSLNFEEKVIPSAGGRPSKVFLLDKEATLILVSGYNLTMRAKIVRRWQELEKATQVPTINLNDPAQLRGLLSNYAERVIALEEKVEEAAPKVEFVEKYVDSEGLLGFREVAKLLKVSEVVLRDWLISKCAIYRLGGGWAFSSSFLNTKRGEHRTGTYGGKVRTSIKFTPKGFAYIAERISK